MSTTVITEKIRHYIEEEYFKDSSEKFTDESPLISSGIIDSIAVLQLVDFLEEAFKFEFEAHEIDQAYLNSVNLIVKFVNSKIAKP